MYSTTSSSFDGSQPLITIEPIDRSDLIKPTASWLAASLILSNIILGTGLLNYPSAYKDAGGIANFFFIQAFALVLVQAGIVIMAYCSDLSLQCTYQDVVKTFTGRVGYVIINFFIVIHDFGSLVSYLIIVGDQIDQVTVYFYGTTYCHHWYLSRHFTLTIASLILILPFIFPRTITSFKFASALGVLAVIYLFILVIYKYFELSTESTLEDVVPATSMKHWNDIFKVLPTVIFSFDAHIESVPLYASLRRRGLPELGRVLFCSCVICLIIYNLVGAFGFLTFGQFVNTDILTNYYPIDVSLVIAMLMVGVKSVLTYPCVFFCPRLVILDVWGSTLKEKLGWEEPTQRYVITVLMFCVSLVLALIVPNIGVVINLLGGTSAVFIFIFPGICLLQAHLYPATLSDHVKKVVGALFICLGAFLVGTTEAQAAQRMLTGELSQSEALCR